MPDVSTQEYFPSQIFRDKNGPCTVLGSFLTASAAVSSTTVIPSSAGKVNRIVSMVIGATGATPAFITFSSSTGPAQLFEVNVPANTVVGPAIFDMNPAGWFESALGDSIAVVITGSGASIQLRYIAFTPSSA